MAKRRKRVVAQLKLQITGGQANPAPPVGPALSQHGVNIGQFINQFNEKTRDQMGVPIPVEIEVYRDGSFRMELKKPPVSYMLKRAAAVAKGSGETGRELVGSVTEEQVREIAEEKMPDLNARDLEGAMNIVKGTARSAGIEVLAPGEEPSVQVSEEEEEDQEAEQAEAEQTV